MIIEPASPTITQAIEVRCRIHAIAIAEGAALVFWGPTWEVTTPDQDASFGHHRYDPDVADLTRTTPGVVEKGDPTDQPRLHVDFWPCPPD